MATEIQQGLSVLIPIYNTDVKSLVISLLTQLDKAAVAYEVLVYDDGSSLVADTWAQMRSLSHPKLTTKEINPNVGRSAIRNRLAQDSQYSHLLFLDADSGIPDETFIQHYLMYWQDYDALVGGTTYSQSSKSKEVALRWIYGHHREQIHADLRNRAKHSSITLNNFLIKRDMFLAVKLDEKISTYGHEDTKLGYALHKMGATVHHIQNPVVHLGLESNQDYLIKVSAGVYNFYELSVNQGIGCDTRLYQFYMKAHKKPLGWALSAFFKLFGQFVRTNLLSSKPKLLLLDCYKLHLMLKIGADKA